MYNFTNRMDFLQVKIRDYNENSTNSIGCPYLGGVSLDTALGCVS